MTIEEYIASHIDAEPKLLHRLYRATHLHLLYPRMASGHLQGRLLKMLVTMVQPKTVLEIGTYSGYSALCIAEGMPADGHLHTIEINDEQEDFTQSWFDQSPYADRIHLHIGNALDIIPQLGLSYDLVFIDADKRHYADYYEAVLPYVRRGGLILADNTLWDGKVPDPQPKESDLQTRGLQLFNDIIARDNRVEKVILPMRDGLTIIRKL